MDLTDTWWFELFHLSVNVWDQNLNLLSFLMYYLKIQWNLTVSLLRTTVRPALLPHCSICNCRCERAGSGLEDVLHTRYLASTPPTLHWDWYGVLPLANQSAPLVKPGSIKQHSTHRSQQLDFIVQFTSVLDRPVCRGLRGLHLLTA